MNKRKINIRDAVDFIDSILGSTWLKENLKKLKAAQGGKVNFGCGIDHATSKSTVAHIAYLWYRAQEEITVAEISGLSYPGPYSFATAVVGTDLALVSHYPGFKQTLSRLKQFSTSKKVIAQLSVASGYARAKAPFVFVDEGLLVDNGYAKFRCEFITLASHHVLTPGEGSQEQKIFYLDTSHGYCDPDLKQPQESVVNNKVQEILAACPCTVVVYHAGLTYLDSHPAMMRQGRVYQNTGRETPPDIYVPNEGIIPDNY